MQGFDGIVGHDEIIEHLQNSIRLGKVSHAYIFGGENGSGKKLIANLFAMTLQCEEHGIEPCLKCASCKKAMSKNHPDIISVTHEKPNSIGIEERRKQLIDDVAIKPYTGPYKIYLVNDAHKLTLQAQNALLKTIEEPPSYAVIILLTDNMDALLPTITSRCVTLGLKPIRQNLVKEYLVDRLHIPEYDADIQASFAQGNIGKAQQMATSEEFAQMTENALQLLKYSHEMELYELVDAIKRMSEEKENIFDYLDLFRMWFRDVLLFKATRDVDSLVFKQEIKFIKEQARRSSYEGLEDIISSIQKAEARLRANVNFDLTMELLFLTIREKG